MTPGSYSSLNRTIGARKQLREKQPRGQRGLGGLEESADSRLGGQPWPEVSLRWHRDKDNQREKSVRPESHVWSVVVWLTWYSLKADVGLILEGQFLKMSPLTWLMLPHHRPRDCGCNSFLLCLHFVWGPRAGLLKVQAAAVQSPLGNIASRAWRQITKWSSLEQMYILVS